MTDLPQRTPPAGDPRLTRASALRLELGAGAVRRDEWLACEARVELLFNGESFMRVTATPERLEDFATGCAITEGVALTAADVLAVEVGQGPGERWRVDATLSAQALARLPACRRQLARGTSGGMDRLESGGDFPPPLPRTQRFALPLFPLGLAAIEAAEEVGALTGCTHAAVWLRPDGTVAGGCEDVGRHVALDKLVGMRARAGWTDGALFLSSRASAEMVRKAAAAGIEIVFAISAPTALAVAAAERLGVTLCAFTRRSRTTAYAHPERLEAL